MPPSCFDSYLMGLNADLRHTDRHAGLRGCCTGPMLPFSHKSVGPWPRGWIRYARTPGANHYHHTIS